MGNVYSVDDVWDFGVRGLSSMILIERMRVQIWRSRGANIFIPTGITKSQKNYRTTTPQTNRA